MTADQGFPPQLREEMSCWARMAGTVGSLRFTALLIIAAALFCMAGTAVPQGGSPEQVLARYGPTAAGVIRALRLDNWFGSPLFIGFLVVFFLDILLCLVRRGPQSWRHILEKANPGQRGRACSFLVLHFGLVMLFGAGALTAATRSIATANIYVGESTDAFTNGRSGAAERLPFGILVSSAWTEYYPVRVMIVVRGKDGSRTGTWETAVGRTIRIVPHGLRIFLEQVDIRDGLAVMEVEQAGRREKFALRFEEGRDNAIRFGDLDIVLDAWRRDAKMVRSEISIIDQGVATARGALAYDRSMAYGGYRIFQRELGVGPLGRPFAGYQVVRDPGAIAVWIALGLVCLGLSVWMTGFLLPARSD